MPLEYAASSGKNLLQEALMEAGRSQPESPAARATPEDLARLSALLDEALELPEARRSDWLERLRAESAPLAKTLAGLLERGSGSETADMLDRGPGLASPATPPEFAAGDTVGPYRLLRHIGQGGMGEVWLAEREDGKLKRQVALKLPMLGLRRSALVQRFERERDILASLEHPHIARLYDAGLGGDGQPYLALEYVDGSPIDRWCREQEAGVEQRVRLLHQVAEAVAYAHGRLVLHRDLKPSNILVTAESEVRLLDFGVAKLMEASGTTEATELTQAFGRALTLRYASPEQLQGEALTTASDVYTLGVVAYELLVGVPPFAIERSTAAAFALVVAPDEAPRASTSAIDPKLRAQLRGDLDAILGRALKKRPEERYPTVDALAQDLRRHLAGERVDARPDSLGYRARRLLARHRLPLAAASVVVLALGLALGAGATALVIVALLVGLASAVWQARRAREQSLSAQTEARTAREVQEFLEGIFRANSAGQRMPVKARQRTAKELLDIGAARIGPAMADAPAAKLRLLKVLAQMYEDMEEPAAAAELLRQHQQLTARLHGGRSVANGEALSSLGLMLAQAEDLPAAAQALQHAGALLDGRADAPARATIALDLGRATLVHRTDPERGIEPAQRALEALRQQPMAPQRLHACSLLAVGLLYARRFDEARQVAEEGVAAAQDAPAEAFGSTTDLRISLGRIAGALGDVDASREHFRAAIELAEKYVGPAGHHTLMGMGLLGHSLMDNGCLLEGLQWLDRAAAILEAAPDSPERSWQMPMVQEYVASARLRVGRPKAALDAALLGLRYYDVARNNVHWAIRLYCTSGQALLDLGRCADGREAIARARSLHDAREKVNPPDQQLLTWCESRVDMAAGQAAAALRRWQHQASDASTSRAGEREALRMLTRRAEVECAAGDAATALERIETISRALAERWMRDTVPELEAQAQRVRGEALLRLAKPAEAAAALIEALRLGRAIFDEQRSPFLAATLAAHARALRARHDRAAARAELAEARLISQRLREDAAELP